MVKRKLPRLSRGWRTVRNLAVVLVCLYGLWTWADYPLPTAELEFRRLERTHLLPRSEIVFTNGARGRDGRRVSKSDGSVFALDGTELYLRGRFVADTREEWAVLACLDRSYNSFIREIPLGGGPVLAPLARPDWYLDVNGYWITQGPGKTPEGEPCYEYKYHNFSAFLLFGAPEGTVRAELTVLDGGAERTGGGWALENGLWLLGVEDGEARDRVSEISYTLRLFDASDTLLAERSGRLWEEEIL